jgi:hypothetical protein
MTKGSSVSENPNFTRLSPQAMLERCGQHGGRANEMPAVLRRDTFGLGGKSPNATTISERITAFLSAFSICTQKMQRGLDNSGRKPCWQLSQLLVDSGGDE